MGILGTQFLECHITRTMVTDMTNMISMRIAPASISREGRLRQLRPLVAGMAEGSLGVTAPRQRIEEEIQDPLGDP